jgi:hypothetical protein
VIKGVVDFYRVEALGVETEHFLGGNLFRIENTFPFLVPEPAGPDMDFHGQIPAIFKVL